MSLVYVIQAEGGPVKVGLTTDLTARLSVYRTHSPLPLNVAHVEQIDCPSRAAAIERTAHVLLAEARLHGSWFKVSAEGAIAAVKQASHDPHSQSQAGALRAARGAALRHAREIRGWSVERLAAEAGATVDHVLAAENGRGHDFERRQLLAALGGTLPRNMLYRNRHL